MSSIRIGAFWLLIWSAILSCGGSGVLLAEKEAGPSPTATDGAIPADATFGAAPDTSTGSPQGEASLVTPTTSSGFLLIDDMEHDCARADGAAFFWSVGTAGGLGNWFFRSASDMPPSNANLPPAMTSFPFGDAFVEPIVPPRGSSTLARHVRGVGVWTAVDLLAQLNHPSQGPVDLSAFAGIAFWARLTSPSGRLIAFLRDQDPFSGPQDFFPAEFTSSPWFAQSVAASSQWQHFILLFNDFRQGIVSGNASGRALHTNAITTIDFVTGFDGEAFDLWIDDLAVLCRGSCPTVPPGPLPCSGGTSPDANAADDAGAAAVPACTPGADQTCNESPTMDALAGSCNANMTCTCHFGFTHAASGRCVWLYEGPADGQATDVAAGGTATDAGSEATDAKPLDANSCPPAPNTCTQCFASIANCVPLMQCIADPTCSAAWARFTTCEADGGVFQDCFNNLTGAGPIPAELVHRGAGCGPGPC
jgi:hypothetical protein